MDKLTLSGLTITYGNFSASATGAFAVATLAIMLVAIATLYFYRRNRSKGE